jgi:hypothetical protein
MVRLLVASAVVLVAAGCVDQSKCHMPSDWKPCAGQTAQPGASGTPPMIVQLSLPTCAYLDSPLVTGTLRVDDPDADQQVLKATFFTGARNNEDELQLDDAGRSGNEWSGNLSVVLQGAMGGMLMEGSDDVVMKVTDRAGGQSAPFCNSIAIVR